MAQGERRTRKMASRCPAAWARAEQGRAPRRGLQRRSELWLFRLLRELLVKKLGAGVGSFSPDVCPLGKGSLTGKAALPGEGGHFLQTGVLCALHGAQEHKKPFWGVGEELLIFPP